MARKIVAPGSFTILVPDVTRQRGGFRIQQIHEKDTSRVSHGLMTGNPGASSGTITVSSDVFGYTDVAATGSFTVIDTVTTPITLTINGNTLTGTNGARTPGSDDFNINGTPETVAADIVSAINDAANSFDTDVVATASGSKVCLTAATAGFTSIDIASDTPEQIQASGAFLTGGFQFGGSEQIITVGDFVLIPGVNWEVVEGDDVTTAANLAAAISNLPSFSATNGGTAVVTITGPNQGGALELTEKAKSNFTVSPENGELTRSLSVGPIEIF